MTLTIRTEETNPRQRVVSKDGKPVADIIRQAAGDGFWVHYFGPTKFRPGGWPRLVDDDAAARDLIKTAADAA